jgi:hypothetical protein
LPIMKPASSKLDTSSSRMPYLSLVCSTSSNQLLINTGSSNRSLCLSYARLKRVFRLSVRLTKLDGHFCPTWPPPHAASSLSAISRTAAYVGANLQWSKSNIYLTITSSSICVSFLELGGQSRRAGRPAHRSCSVVRGTLKALAAAITV